MHLQWKSRFLPLSLATLALGVFYWGLYRMPGPKRESAGLDLEKSRQLQDESAVARRYGRWNTALNSMLKLHAAYPENPIYFGQLAEIYDHLAKYREEAALWEEFIVRAPRPIEACPQLSQAYEKQGLAKEAIAASEKCLALEPNNADSIFILARGWERHGDTDRAAAVYERGVALNPSNADLQLGLARMRLRQGKAEDARAVAAAIVKESPDNTDALLVLGLSCQRLGNRAEARSYLERGVRLADGYADFHLALANMAEQDSDLERAILHYQKVVTLDKTNVDAARKLELLRKVSQ